MATLLAFAAILLPLAASAERDLAAYMRGKMFRMWVNDDAEGATRLLCRVNEVTCEIMPRSRPVEDP